MRELEYRIDAAHDGMRVVDFLRRCHGFSSRVVKSFRHDPDTIDCNGAHIRVVDCLHEGDVLRLRLKEPHWQLPPSEVQVPIAYEDEDILIFNKPAGMPCHPTPAHRQDTLANVFSGLMARRGESAVFRPLNRLDKDTSGLVLAAKNSYAAAWAGESCQKEYLALCCGNIPEEFGRIDLPIGQPDLERPERAVLMEGKPSVTEYRVLRRYGDYTLLQIALETGRTHQIRVHFSHRGHPLAGDTLYGGNTEYLSHQALHCYGMRFCRPDGKTPIFVHGAPEEPFRQVLHRLEEKSGEGYRFPLWTEFFAQKGRD